jgi:asparagine synthase (glutamine-hydrolysing)
MCGIAGIISKDTISPKSEIAAMTDIIRHRGPDGFGYYYGGNFSLGHRRLSIIDLTHHGDQPMKYMDRYVITYNGEVYNYLELRSDLETQGYSFQTETDTEVIMAAYDHWGKDCLYHFNGMWSFALFDKDKNEIFCARDRYGVKPFYYTQIMDKFAFASEIKQFTVINGWKARINKSRLFDFLTLDGLHDHTNETLFRDVYQLQGGEYLEYNLKDQSYSISKWYKLPGLSYSNNHNFEAATLKFNKLFVDGIKLRLRSDVKVGSCLSGGLDSSSIVCIMNDILKEAGSNVKQETVSACFPNTKVDEQRYINEVVIRTGVTNHKVFPSFIDLFPKLDKIIWHQDEPFGSTSIYSQWCVYEEAKNQGIIVMLDGQGADEYLAGYSSYHHIYFRELLMKGKLFKLWRSLRNYRQKYHDYYYNPYHALTHAVLTRIFPENSRLLSVIKKLRKRKVHNFLKINAFHDDRDNAYSKQEIQTIRELSINELQFASLPKLLHHQDRDSMAHSVESRVPFLDYRLVEFVLNMPSDFKVNNAVTKFILRSSMRRIVPDNIIDRYDKLGFATPQDDWVMENILFFKQEVEEACDKLQNYINKNQIMNSFESSVSTGKAIDTRMLWRLICLNRWVKIYKVII